MKKLSLSTFVFIMLFTYTVFATSAGTFDSSSLPQKAAPSITAETAIVADADTGYIYYQKEMHKKMYPASITKILTGILAVENGSDSDVITVTKEAVDGLASGMARVYLSEDEKITQEEALYTMFLASANDSANALAIHTGGSISNFVDMMNSRAKELGAVDSHFSNANGLPDANNVTSAYDMALITQKALLEPKLMKYFGATSYKMPTTNKRTETVEYSTLHKMMKNTVYKYDGVIAGKTGWETMSGHTLVTAAKRGDRTLICVVLKSGSGRTAYKDTAALLDYCFAQPKSGVQGDYLKTPMAEIASGSVSSQPTVPVYIEQNSQIVKSNSKDTDKSTLFLVTALIVCAIAFAFCARQSAKSEMGRRRYRYAGYPSRRRLQSRQK